MGPLVLQKEFFTRAFDSLRILYDSEFGLSHRRAQNHQEQFNPSKDPLDAFRTDSRGAFCCVFTSQLVGQFIARAVSDQILSESYIDGYKGRVNCEYTRYGTPSGFLAPL